MPNHVTHCCAVTGPNADVEQFRQDLFITDDPKALFDFNKIIPMPECLRDSDEGTRSEEGLALIIYRANRGAPFADHADIRRDWIRNDVGMPNDHISDVAAAYLAKHSDFEEAGMKRLRLILETGYASWYPWALKNWGTKWNSYGVEIVGNEPGRFEFKFETAWSIPDPVLAALVVRYPTLTFDLLAFDEGWNFAAMGQLGAEVSEPFAQVKATDELYEAVYGEPPEHEDAA